MRRLRFRLLLLPIALLAMLCMARTALAQELSPEVKREADVVRVLLDNGLEVVLAPRPHLPIAVADVWVGVGSANETPANSGTARFFERMLFTSTAGRPPGTIDRQVNEMGGAHDARVDVDWTHFSIVAPSASITEAIEILADVTQNSDFPAEQSAEAKQALQVERERRAVDPISLLAEATRAAFYGDHPYAMPDADAAALDAQTRRDFLAFRDQYFVPNNMAVVVVGDIDVEATLATVEKTFGALEPRGLPARQLPEIPTRTAPEVVEIAGAGDLGYLNFAWPAPSVRELADVQAFDVLVELLAGSQHARLLKTLQQDLGIVTGGNADYAKTRYPGVFEISAFFPVENRRLVEQAILTEIQRLVDGDLEENEVVRARTSLLAKLARRLETNAALAGELGFSAVTAGDYRLALTAPAGIRAVSAGDVISVAQKYLDPNGYLEVVLASQGAPQAAVAATTLLTETLSNGIRLILQEDPTVDVVAIHTVVGAGSATESAAQAGLTELTQRLLLRGTRARSAEQMADAAEGLGAEIGYATFPDLADLYLVVTGEKLADALPLYLDVLTDPALTEDEFVQVQRSLLADATAARNDPFSVLYDRFRRALYGAGGYANPPVGTRASVRNLTLADVQGFYGQYFVPDNMVVSAVGDFDAELLAARLRSRLNDLPAPATLLRVGAPTVELTATTVVTVGAASDVTWLAFGFPVSGAASADMPAAQMLARVLRDRVDSELFRTLYTGAGVPYSLGYLVTPRRASGDAVLYVVTLPEGVGIVRDTVESVLADIRQNGVDDAELRRARNQELGSFLLTHQTVDSRARQQGTDTALGTMRPLVEDRLAAVRAVTAEDIRRVAETYAQHILIAELGPKR